MSLQNFFLIDVVGHLVLKLGGLLVNIIGLTIHLFLVSWYLLGVRELAALGLKISVLHHRYRLILVTFGRSSFLSCFIELILLWLVLRVNAAWRGAHFICIEVIWSSLAIFFNDLGPFIRLRVICIILSKVQKSKLFLLALALVWFIIIVKDVAAIFIFICCLEFIILVTPESWSKCVATLGLWFHYWILILHWIKLLRVIISFHAHWFKRLLGSNTIKVV